jgi:hypothetical protein
MAADLEERIAKLEAELARKRAAEPPAPFRREPQPRFDPTANFGMPASVVAEMTAAVPDGLVADIVRGNRHNPSQPSSPVPQAPSAPVERGTGWIEERPHGPAPGLGAPFPRLERRC